MFKKLIEDTNDVEKLNKELTETTRELQLSKDELIKSKKEVEEKKKEVEETLEDFYTLRLSMEKHLESKVIKKENQKIRARLEKLKKRKD